MCQPARCASDCVQHRKHLGWKSEGLQRKGRIKVEIWTKPFLDEVIVGKRDALELQRHLKQCVVAMVRTDRFQHLMANLLHNLCSWVVALVHAIAEAHESERIVF